MNTRAWLCLSLLLIGCSDALVDGTWPGEALLSLEGPVQQQGQASADAGEAIDASGTLRMALLWSRPGEGDGPARPVATVAAQTVSTAEFPARYRLELYAPPEAGALGAADVSGKVAIGTLVVYVDSDGDQTYDTAVDTLVGGGVGRLLLYSPDGASDGHFGEVPAGYSRMRLADKAGGSCSPGGPPPAVVPDLDPELPVRVASGLPDGVLLDLNCDGSAQEWGGKACPSPEALAAQCAGGSGPPWPCGACKPPEGKPRGGGSRPAPP